MPSIHTLQSGSIEAQSEHNEKQSPEVQPEVFEDVPFDVPALTTEDESFFVMTGVNAAVIKEMMIRDIMSSTRLKAAFRFVFTASLREALASRQSKGVCAVLSP